MTPPRPPVEVLHGHAPGALRGIEEDFAMLAGTAASAIAARVWTCAETAVVLGVSRDCKAEVNLDGCRARSVAVLRRASGGGTVVIGPGTLQYAIVVGHAAAPRPGGTSPTLDDVKRLGSRLAVEALGAAGVRATISSDTSGDLKLDDRKVAGIAMRRVRDATLLHGSMLVRADLEEIAALLRHPTREPAWRRSRPHAEFLASLGDVDAQAFARALTAAAGRMRT